MHEGPTLTATAAPEAHIIERPRLTAILDASDARMILLVAPAGYGKTTLARQWLRHKEHAWYQATAASADPVLLATHLQRLLDCRSAGRTTIRDLIAADPTIAEDPRALAEAVVEQASRSPGILAIDDYHFIGGAPLADQLVREVLGQDPCRLLLTTRVRPHSTAARELVYGGTCEISTAELTMSEEEIRLILHDTPQAEQIAASASGWPALIGLAVRAPASSPLPEVRPTLVYEFLADELLRDAPDAMEELLVELALAPSRAAHAQEAHPGLVRDAVARGLLHRDDDQISIHPVLADFMKRRLCIRPEGGNLITSTATALLEREAWDDAFALIDEFDRADLLGRLLDAAPSLLDEGRFETARTWQATAERLSYEGAVVDYLRADAACRKGRYHDALRLASGAAERSADATIRAKSLLVGARAAKFAHLPAEAIQLFDLAAAAGGTDADMVEAAVGRSTTIVEFELDEDDRLDQLPDAIGFNPEAALRLATARIVRACTWGPIEAALKVGEDAQRTLHGVEAPWPRSAFLAMHGSALLLSANYPAARRVCEAALAEAIRARFEFGIQQTGLILAFIDIGQGRLTAAARQVRMLTAQARRGASPNLLTASTLLRMRLLIAQGLPGDAVAEAASVVEPPTRRGAAGELVAAEALACACAGEGVRALELANRAIGMTRSIEVHMVAAAATAVAHTSNRASEPASQLISRAQETGNFDACVAALRGSDKLRRAFASVARDSSPQALLAHWLLSIVDAAPRTVAASGDDRLSAREAEVLEFLAQGLTNKQISGALFISDATVKVHLRHIFKKLGVRTRTEAALLAHDSGLTDASSKPPERG